MTKPKRGLVEEAIKLKTSDFGKGLLKTAKSGGMLLSSKHDLIYLDYRVEAGHDNPALMIEYCVKQDNQVSNRYQSIEIAMKELTYGTSWQFRCPCGQLANILYMPRDKSEFLCRHCHNLTYEICNLSKTTMGGLFVYTNKLQRLMEKQEKINHMFYGNRYTRKAQSFYRWQDKWGFGVPEEVKRFAELQVKLNSQ